MSDNDGKSILIGGKAKRNFFFIITTDDELEANTEASEICPVNIIRIEEIRD